MNEYYLPIMDGIVLWKSLRRYIDIHKRLINDPDKLFIGIFR
jgi:hypothetical protein